ncbi:hypothetical protein NDU88_003903 [Pleurodeles waltl]|uniref:Uncharacterized protein n=1 Tax=Pleurodeles waltl TaxID=8319 RepID=A0AAV7UFE9_PLEWA|nr:hypothetical protein NDU88_003903 [Pleurodeles waltl]
MCCRCRLQPGTGGRSSQSPWTSVVKGAAATNWRAQERRKGKGEGRREKREERKKQECGRKKTDSRHGNRRRARTRTKVGTRRKVPRGIRNTDCGTGGAPRSFSHASGEAWHTQVRP